MGVQNVLSRGLTTISSTESDLDPGNVAYDNEGSMYIKCKALAAIAINTIAMVGTTAATVERGFYVPGVINSIDIVDVDAVVGCNEAGLLANGDFFWCKVGPIITVLAGTTGAITLIGAPIYCSATDGEVDDDAIGATEALGTLLTASSGAATLVRLLMDHK